MIAALLALLATQPAPIAVEERWPIVLVVVTPPAPTRVGVSEVRAAVDAALRRATPLYAAPLDPNVGDCEGRVSCIVDALRDRRDAELAVIIALRAGTPERAAALVMDLVRAEAVPRDGGPELRDGAIVEAALRARFDAEAVADDAALEAWAARLAAAAGELHGERWGELVVSSAVAPFDVELDGRAVGTASAAPARLTGLRPGERALRLSARGYADAQLLASIRGGEVTRADVAWIDRRGTLARVRTAVWWGAGATSLAAIALIAAGAAQDAALSTACVRTAEGACPAVGPARAFGGSTLEAPRGVGPLTWPLGVAVGAAGAAMVGAELVGSDEAPWWLAPLIGVAVGAAGYGVGELAAP